MKTADYEIIVFFLILCAGLFEFIRYRKDSRVFNSKETLVTVLILTANIFILKNFKQIASYIDPEIYLFITQLDDYSLSYRNFLNQIDTIFKIEKNGLQYYIFHFIAADFMYFFVHLVAHKVNFFWAWHFCHHTTTKLNIFAGTRNVFKFLAPREVVLLYVFVFVLGFELSLIFKIVVFISLHNIILHNVHLPSIKWLEIFFITPSLHRVHHAVSNQKWAQQVNFGGVLSIWDRLFRTYRSEVENNHKYGIEGFYRSDSLFHSLTEGWKRMFQDLIKARNTRGVFSAIFWKI